MEGNVVNGGMPGVLCKTRILPVDTGELGQFEEPATLETWRLPTDPNKLAPLLEAAEHLKSSSIPVGFPTETVYGLGADATRSAAVKGIYSAKGRPSDNPLIIHVCDLTMLRSLLSSADKNADCIPEVYKPLIKKFWPGPLTILLPNPKLSKLAPEVTAGLPTFGVRMPDSPLALSLICLAGVPLAAPSANASTKPSPTTAEHVLHDLDGRIEIILDGGACQVGVESTVVDGLCDPPVVLRPGGLSIDRIRECEGWERVVKGYKDASEIGHVAPRAPGMKYKHYSPKAKVILYESSCELDIREKILQDLRSDSNESVARIGIVSTKCWSEWAGLTQTRTESQETSWSKVLNIQLVSSETPFTVKQGELWEGSNSWLSDATNKKANLAAKNGDPSGITASDCQLANLVAISLGKDTKSIAHGLFSALRELDHRGVDVIYVEGIEDEGDIAAAVMNRLRKAATIIEK